MYVVLAKNKYSSYWELIDSSSYLLIAYIKSLFWRIEYDVVKVKSYKDMHGGKLK